MAEYIWPVPGYSYISTHFGELDPVGVPHRGTDIPAPVGTDIVACHSGRVIVARTDTSASHSYGNYIIIDCGNGMTNLYAHCSQLLVRDGQTVQKNQVIAKVGATGFVTGPHLHLEFELNGTLVNPENYISYDPDPDPPIPPGPVGNVPIGAIVNELRRRKVIV